MRQNSVCHNDYALKCKTLLQEKLALSKEIKIVKVTKYKQVARSNIIVSYVIVEIWPFKN